MRLSKLLKYTYSKVFAPATISNAGPGFDTFGFALDRLGDIIEVRANKDKGVRISEITGDNGKLSKDIRKNTASVAANSLLKAIDADFGIDMIINKRMPFASGLGSSAASAVAADCGREARQCRQTSCCPVRVAALGRRRRGVRGRP